MAKAQKPPTRLMMEFLFSGSIEMTILYVMKARRATAARM